MKIPTSFRTLSASAAVLSILVAATAHAGPPRYVVINLGTVPFPAGGQAEVGYHINNYGQVTGYAHMASGAYHAFLYSGGKMKDIGTLGDTGFGDASRGYGINDAGWVTGSSPTADETAFNSGADAFLYSGGPL